MGSLASLGLLSFYGLLEENGNGEATEHKAINASMSASTGEFSFLADILKSSYGSGSGSSIDSSEPQWSMLDRMLGEQAASPTPDLNGFLFCVQRKM